MLRLCMERFSFSRARSTTVVSDSNPALPPRRSSFQHSRSAGLQLIPRRPGHHPPRRQSMHRQMVPQTGQNCMQKAQWVRFCNLHIATDKQSMYVMFFFVTTSAPNFVEDCWRVRHPACRYCCREFTHLVFQLQSKNALVTSKEIHTVQDLTAPWNCASPDDQAWCTCVEVINPMRVVPKTMAVPELDRFAVGHSAQSLSQDVTTNFSDCCRSHLESRVDPFKRSWCRLAHATCVLLGCNGQWNWRPSSARYPRLMQASLLPVLLQVEPICSFCLSACLSSAWHSISTPIFTKRLRQTGWLKNNIANVSLTVPKTPRSGG